MEILDTLYLCTKQFQITRHECENERKWPTSNQLINNHI